MTRSYIQFSELFTGISPFELKHLSEAVLCKIEEGFEEKLCGKSSKTELTEKDIKFALTEAMQDILLELRQRELKMKRLKLKQTEVLIFAGRKLVA